MIDQCPTSKKDGLPINEPRLAHELAGTTGRAYWRGLDDLADTPDFRDFLEKEFPAGASELLSGSRRTFIKLMGASLALAGVASMPGCRRPDHKILPYSKTVPEDIVAGRPLFFATSMALPGGGAEGLLVETHEGRPTKIEGNPLHPNNQGKSSVWSQAMILSMYDPDRLKEPVLVQLAGEATAGWKFIAGWANEAHRKTVVKLADEKDEAFKAREDAENKVWNDWHQPGHFNQFDKNQGDGLMVIVDRKTSPTRDAMRDELLAKWPKAKWVSWDSCANDAWTAASTAAFGKAMRETLDLSKAKVIVAFDRDFLQHEAGSLTNARTFAATRRVLKAGQAMSRLYSVESMYTITGASADHRLRLAPSQIPAVVVAVAKKVLSVRQFKGSPSLTAALSSMNVTLEGNAAHYADEIANDLLATENLGKTAVLCGPAQPAWVHQVCVAINAALGNIGACINYVPATADEGTDAMASLKAAAELLNKGSVNTLLCLNVNPCFDAPGDLRFAEAMKKATHRIVLHTDPCETVEHATVRLNAAHTLESWGDTMSADGTLALTQPMIAPLYDGKSDIEVLAMIMGKKAWSGHDVVRATWMNRAGQSKGADFDKAWRRALHDGVHTAAGKPDAVTPDFAKIANDLATIKLAKAPTKDALDVCFYAGMMRDGRFANNGWMQELPDPATKIVWDNAALVSPKTARELGIFQTPETDKKPAGRMVELKVNNRTLRIACWATPGIPENTIVLPMGFGRRVVGLVGAGTGFDVNPLRDSASPWSMSGVALTKVTDGDQYYEISTTQSHGSMEGRAIVRELDKPAWDKFGDREQKLKTDSYGRQQRLSLAEQLDGGELNHMPAIVPVYQDPQRDRKVGYNANRAGDNHATPGTAAYDTQPQWGMTIDLSTCIGCNVCTIACQSENNIAIVGKAEVNKGREMQWIRVDRYFSGEMVDPDGMLMQPVACVHCEAAPCETVCPVNATVHSPEGHNGMIYNRCIGTRYCANNCPYKVRRFNFFDYGVVKFQGGLAPSVEGIVGKTVTENLPKNHNLIPPRLRKQLEEISKLQKNPNVTVRSRGVMEKCSYCVQRTNEAKIDYKLATGKRPEDFFPDGLVQTACQQACPTGAITFGNILDTTTEYPDGVDEHGKPQTRKGSLVYNMREHNRSYLLLGFLATRPRTSHMARVNNPNRELLGKLGKTKRIASMDNPFGSHGGHDSHDGHNHNEKKPVDTKHGFIDPKKAGRDGYILSLGVLPGAGVQA